MCIPEPEPRAAQGALPPDTVNKTVAGFDTSTPAIATPATVVGQPDPQANDFPTFRLSESSDLLPSFGLSSSSSSPALPWGTAEDSSPSFSPNRVREGLSQNVSGEGSLFNVSPLSPGLVVRPTREGGAAPSEGFCYQRCWGTSMIRFWGIQSLMRELNSSRGQNPHCHCLCTHGRRIRPC